MGRGGLKPIEARCQITTLGLFIPVYHFLIGQNARPVLALFFRPVSNMRVCCRSLCVYFHNMA